MNYKIAVLPGDGIGPEVTSQAAEVMKKAGEKHGCRFEFNYGLMGGCAIDESGEPLPGKTLELCKSSDAVLLGAVGGPRWDSLPGNKRPEAGLLALRSRLKLYAILRS
jgi:3-isopropylmalate dehydrogenase